MGFGSRGKRIRHELAQAQGFKCYYCKRPFGAKGTPLAATIEHRIALMDGGTNARDNLVAACRHCNQHRGRQMWAARQKLRANQIRTAVPVTVTISIDPFWPTTS